jgi:hypothetical protein
MLGRVAIIIITLALTIGAHADELDDDDEAHDIEGAKPHEILARPHQFFIREYSMTTESSEMVYSNVYVIHLDRQGYRKIHQPAAGAILDGYVAALLRAGFLIVSRKKEEHDWMGDHAEGTPERLIARAPSGRAIEVVCTQWENHRRWVTVAITDHKR